VVKTDRFGNKSYFIQNLDAPNNIIFGVFPFGEAFIVLDSNKGKVFDTSGNLLASVSISNAKKLMDLVYDDSLQAIFSTDVERGVIYKTTFGAAPNYTPSTSIWVSGISRPSNLILQKKKNRILLVQKQDRAKGIQVRSALNGVLVQEADGVIEGQDQMKQVTEKAVSTERMSDLVFANKIAKHTKSNTIVLAKNLQLIASGTGQTSRVDALKQAIEKAHAFNLSLEDSVMASDAFFPFPDCVEIAFNAGVRSVVQPGGSIKDDLSIAYCNQVGMAMVTTGVRHFKH
jgi:hypothetical protein